MDQKKRNRVFAGMAAFTCAAAIVLLAASFAFAGGTSAGTGIDADGTATWDGGSNTSNTVTSTVEAAYGMELLTPLPDNASGIVGAQVTYTFKIKSVANCQDTLCFTILDNTWITTLSADNSGVLNADTEFTLDVTVTIPSGAKQDDTDTFTLIIKDKDGDGTSDNWPAVGVNDDTLTYLVETTALAPYIALTMAVDKPAEKPYRELVYTGSYENTGGAAATNAVLTFVIPANTDYVSATGGDSIEYYYSGDWHDTPGTLSAVERIRFHFASISTGATGDVTFTVKIE